MKFGLAVLAVAGSVLLASDAAAQEWRALRSARQLHDTGAYDVRVKYTVVGEPDFRMPAPGLVMTTYFLTSRRTMPTRTRLRSTMRWRRCDRSSRTRMHGMASP